MHLTVLGKGCRGQVPLSLRATTQSPPMCKRFQRIEVVVRRYFRLPAAPHPQKPFHRGYPAVFLSFRFFSFAPSPLLAPRNSITLDDDRRWSIARCPHNPVLPPESAGVLARVLFRLSLSLSLSLSLCPLSARLLRVSFRPTVVPGSQGTWLQTFS